MALLTNMAKNPWSGQNPSGVTNIAGWPYVARKCRPCLITGVYFVYTTNCRISSLNSSSWRCSFVQVWPRLGRKNMDIRMMIRNSDKNLVWTVVYSKTANVHCFLRANKPPKSIQTTFFSARCCAKHTLTACCTLGAIHLHCSGTYPKASSSTVQIFWGKHEGTCAFFLDFF